MKKGTVVLFTIVVCLACQSPPMRVTSDYDHMVTFSNYKTFAVATYDKVGSISELNAGRIFDAVADEMVKKGFTEKTTDPDLKVHVAVVLKDKTVVTANTDFYGYGGMYRPYSWVLGPESYTTYDVTSYVNGSLIINVIDQKRNQLVWEGIGNKQIDKPLKDPDQEIPAAVAKIMENFPPK